MEVVKNHEVKAIWFKSKLMILGGGWYVGGWDSNPPTSPPSSLALKTLPC